MLPQEEAYPNDIADENWICCSFTPSASLHLAWGVWHEATHVKTKISFFRFFQSQEFRGLQQAKTPKVLMRLLLPVDKKDEAPKAKGLGRHKLLSGEKVAVLRGSA